MESKKAKNQKQFDGQDNNGQDPSGVHGGEHRNGRLSPFKNHNAHGEDTPNEYVNKEQQ